MVMGWGGAGLGLTRRMPSRRRSVWAPQIYFKQASLHACCPGQDHAHRDGSHLGGPYNPALLRSPLTPGGSWRPTRTPACRCSPACPSTPAHSCPSSTRTPPPSPVGGGAVWPALFLAQDVLMRRCCHAPAPCLPSHPCQSRYHAVAAPLTAPRPPSHLLGRFLPGGGAGQRQGRARRVPAAAGGAVPSPRGSACQRGPRRPGGAGPGGDRQAEAAGGVGVILGWGR